MSRRYIVIVIVLGNILIPKTVFAHADYLPRNLQTGLYFIVAAVIIFAIGFILMCFKKTRDVGNVFVMISLLCVLVGFGIIGSL